MMNAKNAVLVHAPLGKQSAYISQYQKDLLFAIPRQMKREEIGISSDVLPFQGKDIWNAFELSWLNPKGKPVVATAEFAFPCESSHLIESKSFKLYLNSFNNTSFESMEEVERTLIADLSEAARAPVSVKIKTLGHLKEISNYFNGTCLDNLDVHCDTYTTYPDYLTVTHQHVTETVFSDLLKSNCLVTGQPDWGSVQITYTGRQIQHEGLLKYIISFRNHDEFHEQCVERIFTDIMKHCAPQRLLVYARYTRRGGLDINPYRANYAVDIKNLRLWRQ